MVSYIQVLYFSVFIAILFVDFFNLQKDSSHSLKREQMKLVTWVLCILLLQFLFCSQSFLFVSFFGMCLWKEEFDFGDICTVFL